MNREIHVRFCERAGLRCSARLTYVEGRLRTREYEARNNGGKRQRTEIIASRVQFLGRHPPTPRAPKSAAIARQKKAHSRSRYLRDARAAQGAGVPPSSVSAMM